MTTTVMAAWLQSAELHHQAVSLALLAAGGLFMTGLLTGLWKYAAMARSPQARAPHYVDVAHRTSLFYAFASLLVAVLAALSPWSVAVTWWSVAGPLVFFVAAVGTYLVHGWLNDTRNQLARPYVLGRFHLPGWVIHGFMAALSVVEIAGIGVLVTGLFLRLTPYM